MTFRIIHSNKEAPGVWDEKVAFTEDLEAPADDFIDPGFRFVSDTVINQDMPHGFPANTSFEKY